ncbi:MAG: hypothetical protein QOF92_4853 [Pseudonocardiales bacterium]|jgi:hypothetical protein|nr:hypothetical protein [Pseudonocardiales bacterium]
MGLLGTAVKIGVIGKVAQIVQREASKPENRKKIADAMNSLKQRAGSARRPGA